MDKLEKVERLRKSANVTYEEAVEALDACGQDLLDAIVMLEKQGKTAGPQQSTYSTDYQAQEEYIDVSDRVEQQQQSAPTFRKTLAGLFRALVRFVRSTNIRITRNASVIIELPSWVMLILLLLFWKAALPVVIIAWILGFRCSFRSIDSKDNKHDTPPKKKGNDR